MKKKKVKPLSDALIPELVHLLEKTGLEDR